MKMRKLAVDGGSRAVPEGLAVSWPIIRDEDKQSVLRVLERGTLWGPYAPEVSALEAEWADYVGVRHCLALNSGTAALHCAIAAAGVGPGDEVITPAFSFLASATAIVHNNAIPVFADIDPRTYNISTDSVEEQITPLTKAIVAVDIHGLPADWDELHGIAERHGLILIEDSCQAHGSTYKGRKAGTLAPMATFSLNSTKNLVGGEGGLFVTDSDEYLAKANMTRMFGEHVSPARGRSYKAYTLGWHYRSQELPAALARSQLKLLDSSNQTSVRNGKYLTEQLGKIDGITPPFVPDDRTTNYHKYRVRLDPGQLGLEVEQSLFRDQVLTALRAEGVSVALWQTFPLPGNPLFTQASGYGLGCPFSCPHYKGSVQYDPAQYPETALLCDSSIIVGAESYPLYCQPMELMEHYAEAFRKVFGQLESVLQINPEIQEQTEGHAELV